MKGRIEAIEMADAGCQVEDVVAATHGVMDCRLVADIGDAQVDLIFDPAQVEAIATHARRQSIEHGHAATERSQRVHQVAADEAQPARNQRSRAFEPLQTFVPGQGVTVWVVKQVVSHARVVLTQ
jgi:hypothetical protein